jgi:hypothetical protein
VLVAGILVALPAALVVFGVMSKAAYLFRYSLA